MNNDIISRSELKKALRQRQWHIDDIEEVEKIIDNAPTVSFMISPDYVTELQNRNKELIKQLEELERPQGEAECMEEDAKQASIPYTYSSPQHDWKCGYPDSTGGKKD